MVVGAVGYEFLRQELALPLPQPRRIAAVRPVTRVEREAERISVPLRVAPEAAASSDDLLLDHVLFALRHEGVNLAILRDSLEHIPAELLARRMNAMPTSGYLRQVCMLWEAFRGERLAVDSRSAGAVVDLFDPQQYVTDPSGPVDRRWRVRFNGLGTIHYCAVVERTPRLSDALAYKPMERLDDAIQSLGDDLLRRALEWAYLSETNSSFAIEHETPPQTKAQAYVALLRQAHEQRPLSEEYLVALQNEAITQPRLHEVQFRTEQNWLRRGGTGALSVTYVPPEPDLCFELMQELISYANRAPRDVDPLVLGAVQSFGFVFLHPFLDGNGRLSRYLIHHALCRSGALQRGFLLPISAAIHRHEGDYLQALSRFSRPAREFWSVTQVDEARFACAFRGSPSLYRYWDATPAAEFVADMARIAVEEDLLREAELLRSFDRIYSRVSARYDARSNDLATLINIALREGSISKNKRKRYADAVPEGAMSLIEEEVRDISGLDAAEGEAAEGSDEAEAFSTPRART